MKTSIAMLIVLVLLILFWFWPKPESQVHLVILLEQQGLLAGRDQVLARLTSRFAQQDHADRYRISLLDSSRNQTDLLHQLEQLHQQYPVDLLLGCGDSVCVRTILPWLEEHQRLLLYPGSSEGLLSSRLVVHAGLTANQYLYPALQWAQQQGARLMFIGSNSARSYMHLKIMQEYPGLREQTDIAGYELISHPQQLSDAVSKILDIRPDVVLLDICEWQMDADIVQAFGQLPVRTVSLCVDLPPPDSPGMYYLTAFNHVVDHPESRRIQALDSHPGALLVNTDWLFRQLDEALQLHIRPDTALLQDFFSMRSGMTAAGLITIDRHFRGGWQRVFLLRRQLPEDQLIWYSAAPVRPLMFPASQSPSDWMHHLTIYWRNAGGFWRRLDGGDVL